jgi:riboflavin kinase/FMN adenylyltransferase
MQIFRQLPPRSQRTPCAVTIGNFDGVHRGHQSVIGQLRARARDLGLPTCVLTFEPHPRAYFAAQGLAPQAPARIQTTRDKLAALSDEGIDRVCITRFDQRMAGLTAEDFFAQVIVKGLMAKYLLVGDDFRFGRGRAGDFASATEWGQARGIEVAQMATLQEDGSRVSSSAVRAALAGGDFGQASQLLGRPYRMSGRVLHGRKLGRTIGFPTLNLRVPFERPALAGIFVVQVHGLADGPLPGVASLGTRPAVEADGRLLLEVHLFDFSRQVYGAAVCVEFLEKIRDEQHYSSLELLTAQIERDAQHARAFFARRNTH